MAGVVFPNVGERSMLKYAKTNFNSYTCTFKLFQGGGSVVINADTVLSTLDADEADFSGYGTGVTRADWSSPVTDGGGNAYTFCSSVTFQHDGGVTGNTIYGWYMVDGDGDLVCCEEFASSYTMDSELSAPITFTPKIYARQAT